MVSEGDQSSIDTALRESEEELGLSTTGVDIWGSMLPLPDRVSYRRPLRIHPTPPCPNYHRGLYKDPSPQNEWNCM